MMTDDIYTDRLRIRSTREADGEFCLSLWLDEEMGKYLSDPPRELADEAELNFAKGIEQDDGWYPFVAELRETGARIATCSLVPDANETCWDIGYCVHRNFWRQGYATEMVRALIEFARSRGGRIFTADVAKENAASCALMRKLGFVPIESGTFKKRLTDIVYEQYTYRLETE